MSVFNGNNVKVGPGTLYAAPLGTVEPTSITGAWPAGWVAIGYTDTGSVFSFTPTVQAVMVEEEYYPVRQAITEYQGDLTFAMAEQTRQNLALALNAGIGSSLDVATQGTFSDGSLWQEPPTPGTEQRVMLGWDALPEAATTGSDPFGRLISRQMLQGGAVQRSARKGSNKSMWAVKFLMEKPPGVQPWRFIVPSTLAA